MTRPDLVFLVFLCRETMNVHANLLAMNTEIHQTNIAYESSIKILRAPRQLKMHVSFELHAQPTKIPYVFVSLSSKC